MLKQGDGAVVKSDDTISLQYQGVLWRTGKIFDQSWGRGVYSGAVTGFVPGFTKALDGQKVGSQVIVIIPPADGYGTEGQRRHQGHRHHGLRDRHPEDRPRLSRRTHGPLCAG